MENGQPNWLGLTLAEANRHMQLEGLVKLFNLSQVQNASQSSK